LARYYDDLIIASTTAELIEAGHLSPFRIFAPSHPDLSGVRTVAGDFHEGDLSRAMDRPQLVADIVQTWLERGEDRPTFCFGVDRAHAKTLQRQFEAAGIATEYIDAHTDRIDREKIKLKFEHGLVKVVVNVGCLTTGIDWDVRCIILARPTKSEILYTQLIGRGLRTTPGKDDCLILDHSDTTLRLGFVTDIHHDALDDGRERVAAKRDCSEALPQACDSCAFLRPPKVHVCPSCGFAPERRSNIKCGIGELVEVTPRRPPASHAERQRWFSGLVHIAQHRGYKNGWAAHQFKTRFGSWPDDMLPNPAPPDSDITNWVRSRQIAYAKMRSAA
jgi:superfamily II DNA or RNA helicase